MWKPTVKPCPLLRDRIGDRALRGRPLRDDPPRLRQQGRTGRGQRDSAMVPLEEGDPQRGLQPADLLAQRWLGDEQPAGRAGEKLRSSATATK